MVKKIWTCSENIEHGQKQFEHGQNIFELADKIGTSNILKILYIKSSLRKYVGTGGPPLK